MLTDNAGNTLSTARVLPVNSGSHRQSLSDRVDSSDLFDYYQFQLSIRTSISASINSITADVNLDLLQSDGTVLRSSRNSQTAAELLTVTLEPGTYYLQVTPNASDNTESNYTLNLWSNSNPQTEILWRHQTVGANVGWQMAGNTVVGGTALMTIADPNWQLVGSSDFNRDGLLDYLWRNQVSGMTLIWQMSANGKTDVMLPTVDSGWQIATLCDLNNDGETDIIWRHKHVGVNAVWYMNGTTPIGGANLITVADLNWQIAGGGDFNTDGRTDLLWRHSVSGTNAVWLMDNAKWMNSVYLAPVADSNWGIAGIGDFNTDGKSDLLWRHRTAGINQIWFMNGTAIAGSTLLPTVDNGWQIAAVTQRRADPTVVDLPGNTLSTAFDLGNLQGFNAEAGKGHWQVSDRVDAADRIDFYRFSLNQVTDVNLSINSQVGLEILDQAGNTIGRSRVASNDLSTWAQRLTVGNYYLKVSYTDKPSPYTLVLLAQERPATQYSFIYYTNGFDNSADSYSGYVYGYSNQYQVNTYYDFTPQTNEIASNGRYYITSAITEGTAADLGKVIVTSYYDRETNQTLSPFSGSGSNFLGSESGYLTSTMKPEEKFGQDYYVADFPYLRNAQLGGLTNIFLGNAYTLTWDDNLSDNVKVELLYRNSLGQDQVYTTVSLLTESDGIYSWVPAFNLPTSNIYRLRISSLSNPNLFTQTNTFTTTTNIYKYSFSYFYNGISNSSDYYTGWVYGDAGKYTVGNFVDPNPGLNETGANGRYQITNAVLVGSSLNAIAQERGKVYIDRYYDVDASGQSYVTYHFARNLASGTNDLGTEQDFINGYLNDSDYDLSGEGKEFDALPDLRGQTFDVVPTSGIAGNSVQVNFQIANLQRMRSGAFRTSFYLSTDATITASDYLLGSQEISSLSSLTGTGLLSQILTLPSATHPVWLTSGTYYLGMIIDSTNVISEARETNNANQGQGQDWDSLNITLPSIFTNFAVTDASGDGSANVVFQQGALQVSWNSSGVISNTKLYARSNATGITILLGNITNGGLFNLNGINLAAGNYWIYAEGTDSTGSLTRSSESLLELLAFSSANSQSVVFGDFKNNTHSFSGMTKGSVFLGRGGKDTLSFQNISSNDVTFHANTRSIFGGTTFDWIRVNSTGSEVYFQGYETLQFSDRSISLGITPNDPSFSQQWNLQMMNVSGAWRFTTGSTDILLGVADSGLAIDTNNNPTNNDLNGGRTLTSSNDYDADWEGHGTKVATILAADTNDGVGIAGINWNSAIYISRVFGSNAMGFAQAALEQIQYAQAQGKKLVINISGEYTENYIDTELAQLMQQYADTVLFVIASGNSAYHPVSEVSQPATFAGSYGNVMAIGAAGGSNGTSLDRHWYSQYGPELTLVATSGILATNINGSQETVWGTSFATPSAAGVASLVWSVNNGLTAATVRDILQATAYRQFTAYNVNEYGAGMLDAEAAVRRADALARNSALATLYTHHGLFT
ncbi:S8 family serine peptidase [Alkalinema sp. FACHB-956]|uniref:S8 family serine peptidase n=1 Tax=Alkalinema sp. FACHB-956 TaxID=2692768 RepID=UPI001687FD34|nr:S8 family serine peptidase [Alkalinema sp. FACHB-956]MBD2325867.1 S8 family serine peptidase [Alkalinema sp. FACHB-956]